MEHDYAEHAELFAGTPCGGREDPAGNIEPCSGVLEYLGSGQFVCTGPGRHLKLATILHGQPGVQDLPAKWVSDPHRPRDSGLFGVRFPDGAVGTAWWNLERRRWEEVEENEAEGYSTTGAPCEVAGWRPKPTL